MQHNVDPQQLVSDIKAQWRRDGLPNAETCLARYRTIAGRKSLVLELAYEEYCLRQEAGDSIDVHLFCGRFPSVSHSLLRQIDVHQYFIQHPDLLASDERVQWPVAGDVFLGFRVLQELGRGALARVYLCLQPGVGDRQVVCKIAHRGAYEADTLGRLKHPNIVPVHSVAEDQESQASCICMPFCGRSTLCDLLDIGFTDNQLPTRARVILEAANQHRDEGDRYDRVATSDSRLQSASYVDGVLLLGVQLADALHHAHEHWIFHGDLKPSNILITPDGRPMLLDFNLCQDRHQLMPVTGGTLPYMSPEQVRSNILDPSKEGGETDVGGDIYSLATILYELLSGQLPYGPMVDEPLASLEFARKRIELQREPPRPLAELNPAVDAALSAHIQHCLAYERAARPASMRDVAWTLQQHLSAASRTSRWVRLHRRAVLAGAVGFGMTCAAALTFGIVREATYPIREYNRGLALYNQGEYDTAQECFSRVIEQDAQFGDAYYQRGRALIKLGRYNEAFHQFGDAAEFRTDGRDDACKGYCYSLAAPNWALAHSGAVDAYHEALRKGFESVGLYNNLAYSVSKTRVPGDMADRLSRLKIAKDHLSEAISIDADSAIVYFQRATLDLQEIVWRSQDPDYTYVPDTGIRDIEEAVMGLSPNMHVDSTAAMLYGYAAAIESDYMQPCLDHLRTAIHQGYDPQRFGIFPAFDSVRETDEFQALLKLRPTQAPPPPIDLLIDPIDDMSTAPRD